jgi:ubiquinone/menaquinone biosynthesis C-methylase UbiE
MAKELEEWGEGTSWREVMFLLSMAKGPVLDIACGTGKVMELASVFAETDIYGCDVSDLLIAKAIERGLPEGKLKVCDFTKNGYPDAYFEHSYSLGSLEHFTDQGIDAFLSESRRITRGRTFHMIPVSRSGENDGWITTTQSYFNNSSAWWEARFRAYFGQVYVLDSAWGSVLSRGQWFICSQA